MSEVNSGDNVLRELELQNPGVASAFRSFRWNSVQHTGTLAFDIRQPRPSHRSLEPEVFHEAVDSERSARKSVLISILLLCGVIVVAITAVPSLLRFLAVHWQAVLLPAGGVCIGAGAVLLLSRVGTSPLRAVTPPKADTEDPLQELKNLAERTASRLRAAYRMQLFSVLTVGAIFLALIVWSMVLVSQNRLLYASAFGSGSVSMVILTKWKWQPFDRIDQARRLADNADILGTGLRLRMKTVSEIADPSARAKAQWEAVEEYLSRS